MARTTYSYDRRIKTAAMFMSSKNTVHARDKVPFPVVFDEKDGRAYEADEAFDDLDKAILEAIHDANPTFLPYGSEPERDSGWAGGLEEVVVDKVEVEFVPYWDKKHGSKTLEGTDEDLREIFKGWASPGRQSVSDTWEEDDNWSAPMSDRWAARHRPLEHADFVWMITHVSGFRVLFEARDDR